ncbi:MAG: universal stress protein E [Planctomycetota bacterium]|jgi:universal stress protein E
MYEFKRIVVGLKLIADGSAVSLGSQKAAQQAIWVAMANGGTIQFLHSTFEDQYHSEALGTTLGMQHEGLSDAGRNALDGIVTEACNSGLDAELFICKGRTWLEIIRLTLSERVDLVVVGKRSEDTDGGRRLGNVAKKLLRKCPTPVWVVRPEHDLVHRLVLAATDLTPVGDQAVRCAAFVAERHECDFQILHAWQMTMVSQLEAGQLSDEERGSANDAVKRKCVAHIATSLGEYRGKAEPVIHTSKGAPARTIREAVTHLDPDLLVMGTVSRVGVPGMLLGSTAERMLDRVDCSILTVKPEGFVSPITL